MIFIKDFVKQVKGLSMRSKVVIAGAGMVIAGVSPAFAVSVFTDTATYDPTALITQLLTYTGLLIAAVVPLIVLRVTLPTAIRWVTTAIKKIHL